MCYHRRSRGIIQDSKFSLKPCRIIFNLSAVAPSLIGIYYLTLGLFFPPNKSISASTAISKSITYLTGVYTEYQNMFVAWTACWYCQCTFPPPGWCFMFSVDPILDLTFFRSGMGAAAAASGTGERVFSEPGDLGFERTTATFFTLLASAAAFAWLAGDFGVPGLLCPLWPS